MLEGRVESWIKIEFLVGVLNWSVELGSRVLSQALGSSLKIRVQFELEMSSGVEVGVKVSG